MGQYGRRLYQRIDSVPNQNNEKAEGFSEFVKRPHWKILDFDMPDVVPGRHIELVPILPT